MLNEMPSEVLKFAIPIIQNGVEAGTATVEMFADEEPCRLVLTADQRTIESTGDDFFVALQRLRSHIEPDGIRLLCYGASLNCYPSPMSRDMG